MKIKKGQEIDFKIPEASSDRYKAEVHLVGTSIEENRTIKVHGHLENEEKTHFLTGMFINASIITDSAFAKAVPNEAVVEVDGVFYVLVLDQKEGDTYYFNQEEVKVKSSYNGFTVIENKSSFDSETKFLTQGAFNLIGD
jgi:cobalt-zinc-cadmium efflux system membrane fusion protein